MKRFPSKTSRLTPYFRSFDTQGTLAQNSQEIEKRERWLEMDKLDPNFGITGTSQEVFIRRSYRRLESSALFNPPRMGASLAELDLHPPQPEHSRYILVEESRLRELAQIELILKQEKAALGEQVSWIISDYHIDARIPIPATRVAVNNLCQADMRRLAREFEILQSTWLAYYNRNHYDRDIAHTALSTKSYITNAPLAMRPSKFVQLDAERIARQMKMERDCLLYEDDRSFIICAHHRASARKKDYERYFILATRYGHMTEAEFARDERPGRRYWVRALDACLKFQRIWGSYWAVQSMRRYKGAKQFQKIVRAFLAYKKYHPLIIFRLKYGKSSYQAYAVFKWKLYIKTVQFCREGLRWWSISVRGTPLNILIAHWKQFTQSCREGKEAKLRRVVARFANSGLVRCYLAWAWLAKRQKYIKLKARRILGTMGPQFDLWCEYVEISKHLRKMYRTASLLQSVVRMYRHRKVFKAKRKIGFLLGIIMRCRYITEMRRVAEVNIDFEEWKFSVEEKRAVVALDGERARLQSMQAYIVEREKEAKASMRKHLRSAAGRFQLMQSANSLVHSQAYQIQQAELQLYSRCLELGRCFAKHDYTVAHPPLFQCVDPACGSTFTSEDQYHRHYRVASNHKPKRGHHDQTIEHNAASKSIGSRKKASAEMQFNDRQRVLEAAFQPTQHRFLVDGSHMQAVMAKHKETIATQKQILADKEQDYKVFKLEYVKESKSTKQLLQGLELSNQLTKGVQIKELSTKQSVSSKNYASKKVDHTKECIEMQKEIDQMQRDLDKLSAQYSEYEGEYTAEKIIFDQKMNALQEDRDAEAKKKREQEEAAQWKKEMEDKDPHSHLTYSTMHALLLHPKEFQVLRNFLLSKFPHHAEIRPSSPTATELAIVQAAREAQEEKNAQEAKLQARQIRVKGWVFVKGRGWLMSKKVSKDGPHAREIGKNSRAASTAGSVKGGSKRSADWRLSRRKSMFQSSTNSSSTTEPPRDNSLSEVQLLNCLDLWKAIQVWKDTSPSTDLYYTSKAIRIFETFLMPEQVQGDESEGTVVKSGEKKHLGHHLAAVLARVARIFPKFSLWRRSADDSSSDDEESNIDTDSDDSVQTKQIKQDRRARRAQETKDAVIVKRTVDLSVLEGKWSRDDQISLLKVFEAVRDGNMGKKKPSISYLKETSQPLSFWRKMLKIKPRVYNCWTDRLVLPPDIFNHLHWALFQHLYAKVHLESGFERSPDFVQYKILCAADEAEKNRLLFKEAKRARMDRFRKWSRDDFVAKHRAEYRLGESGANGAMQVVIDALVTRAFKLCVGEFILASTLTEQITTESSNLLSDDALYWTMQNLSDEWYDSYVETYVKNLIGMGGDVRSRLMVFCGMREYDAAAALKVKKAYDTKDVKAFDINSFLNDSVVIGDKQAEFEEGSSIEEKVEVVAVRGPKHTNGKGLQRTLSGSQKVLEEMMKLTGEVESMNASGKGKKDKKDKLDRITAIRRIQRRIRGNQGRKKARSLFVKIWLKRFDSSYNVPYYINVQTNESQWTPPRIHRTLFPWNRGKQW